MRNLGPSLFAKRGRTAAGAPLEKNIQDACIQWLNFVPGVTVWRQNTGIKSGEHANKAGKVNRYFVKYGEPGQSDIGGIVAPGGIMLQIEVKRPGMVPTTEQDEWINKINRNGGIAFWTDSLADCCVQLKMAFIARGMAWNESWGIR